jgi:hypothetical protein
MLKQTTWGAYRDDHKILPFQEAIMSTGPRTQTITQHDTQMAQPIVQHNDVWTMLKVMDSHLLRFRHLRWCVLFHYTPWAIHSDLVHIFA